MASRKQNKSLYAVLGILAQRDASGYEIQKIIASSIGYFWSESFGQIYPVLKELGRKGLIKSASADVGRKTRTRHRITAKGRKTLATWLAQSPEPEVIRNELLLKVFFGAHGDGAAIAGHLEAQRQKNNVVLAEFDKIGLAMPAGDAAAGFWQLTLDYGRRAVAAELLWLEEALSVMAKIKPLK